MRGATPNFRRAAHNVTKDVLPKPSRLRYNKGSFFNERQVLPVKNCRNISKADMVYNNVCGDIRVDPETYTVTVDGEVITCEPFDELALAQRYFMF